MRISRGFVSLILRRKNMKKIRIAPTTVLSMIGIFWALIGLNSPAVFSQVPLETLQGIPWDASQVLILNMQRFSKSPLYARLMREESPISAMNNLKSFSLATGADPAHDISYLIMSSSERSPIMIASGRFEYARINKYLRCSMHPEEENYNNVAILKFPAASGMGIAFLNQKEIAVGNIAPLKTIIDTRAGLKRNIFHNSLMALLISASNADGVFRIASRSISVLNAFSAPYPLPSSIDPNIKGIAGTLNITDIIAGKVDVITIEENAAKQAMKTWDASAPWRRPEGYIVVSQLLTSGLTVNRTGPQIEFTINFTTDALEKYWSFKNGSQPNKTEFPPAPFLKPMPPYTKEALDAKIVGTMRMQLTVQKDGTPADIKVINGLGYGLDESAVGYIADLWRFMPAIRNGGPVDSRLIIDIPFKYEDNRWQ